MTVPRARLVALVLPLILAACAAGAAPSLVRPEVSGGIPLVASGTTFDRSTVSVPANRAFSLVFENRDGDQHNVSITSAGGGAPVTTWRVGEIIADSVSLTLPANAPPGDYTAEVGWYDFFTGQRLFVLDADGQAVDSRVALGSVSLKAEK